MAASPSVFALELRPQARFDLIDVRRRLEEDVGDELARYRRVLYCSHHTTAGYLEQSLCARLRHDREQVNGFIRLFRHLFPPEAPYQHDRLERRRELSDEQRESEPLNADSHLTYIGSGLNNCVSYVNRAETPVFFIDLDGVFRNERRRRQTTVIAYDREELVESVELALPVSRRPVDAVNLKDPQLGLFDRLEQCLIRHGVDNGRVRISLAPTETHAGLTVNEYETLLMKHDLAEVLRHPFEFMAQKGRHILADPRAVPHKTLNYARYDVVRVINELLDVLGVGESRLERLLAKFIAKPASRFLRMRSAVSFPLRENDGRGSIVCGRYQSPILVQWQPADRQTRWLRVDISRFV
ncbi:MAG: hypothetical protein JSV80_15995 [Acidobacteriota bacterium]|nr:MAG: hypothetical protein JSV80_15995 [Acidobacteriota bacterium]